MQDAVPRRRHRAAQLAPPAVAALLALVAPAHVTVTSAVEPATTGRLVLFANPDFTGAATKISYTACQKPAAQRLGEAGSFDNQLAAGCQTVLLGSLPDIQLVLCAGRGVVPPAFRKAPLLRIQPGVSPPCATAAARPVPARRDRALPATIQGV